jgi:hypothetical protein
MSRRFHCPYLNTTIELTDEREQHITVFHPGTLPDYLAQLEQTRLDSELVRCRDRDPNAIIFSKWFETIRTGRYLIVVVVDQAAIDRHWIITTYTARKITGGTILWQKT